MADIDDFLKRIARNESNFGQNTNHRMITSGMHKGTRAIGTYALMPKTVDEIVTRTKDDNLKSLLDMDPVSKKQYIEQNKDVEEKLARTLAQHVLHQQKGDPQKAAYSWLYGHNLSSDSIDERDYQNDDYVQKFNRPLGGKDHNRPKAMSNNIDLFAPPTTDELQSAPAPTLSSREVASTDNSDDLFAPPSSTEMSAFSKPEATPVPTQEPSPQPEGMSQLEAGIHGLEQGVSGSFFDELSGGAEALGTAVGLKGAGGPLADIETKSPSLDWEDIKKAYIERRDAERTKVHQAQNEHPGTFLAGNVGGSFLMPAGKLLKGTSMATQGVTLGAINGLGASEADNVKDMAIDTGVGAGTGYLFGKAGDKLSKALTPEATQARAAARAVKALGEKPLPENLPMGKVVLDEGVLPMMGGGKAINDAVVGKMTEIEKDIVQPTLDAVSKNSGLSAVAASRQPIENIVNKVASEAISDIPASSTANAGKRAIERAARYWTDKLKDAGGDPKKLNDLRKLIDGEAKKAGAFGSNPDLLPKADFLAKLRDVVNDELRAISSNVSTGAGQTLEQGMARQSALYGARDASAKLIEKDIVHPPGSIIDAFKNPLRNPRAAVGSLAVYSGNPWALGATAAGVAAEKVTQNPIGRLGNIASARAQNFIANNMIGKAALKTGEIAAKIGARAGTSTGVQSGIQSVYSVHNEKLKQIAEQMSQQPGTADLANALNNSINSGDEDAKNRILFAMEQRPDTRAQLKEFLAADSQENTEELPTEDESSY
jgi:hypothetical protein